MSTELFFIYDSHCPWSYATTELVNEIAKNMPNIAINFWHSAYFEGEEGIKKQQITDVQNTSDVSFGASYIAQCQQAKDSTLAANILAWADQKAPHATLQLLQKIQQAHFQQGIALTQPSEFEDILSELKLSPPNKSLKSDKLTKDAEYNLHDIFDMQELIGTKAIPALLLAINDNLILLNHNLYLAKPNTIIDAVNIELAKNS